MCSKFCGDDVLLLPSPVKLIRNSAFYSDSLHFLPVRVHLRSSASAPCRFHSRSVQLSHLLCSSQIHSALRRAKHLAPPRAQGRASALGQQGLDTSPPPAELCLWCVWYRSEPLFPACRCLDVARTSVHDLLHY